jgi:hypothetical protein
MALHVINITLQYILEFKQKNSLRILDDKITVSVFHLQKIRRHLLVFV